MTLETMLKALHYREAVEEAVKASIRKNTSRISELASDPAGGAHLSAGTKICGLSCDGRAG